MDIKYAHHKFNYKYLFLLTLIHSYLNIFWFKISAKKIISNIIYIINFYTNTDFYKVIYITSDIEEYLSGPIGKLKTSLSTREAIYLFISHFLKGTNAYALLCSHTYIYNPTRST